MEVTEALLTCGEVAGGSVRDAREASWRPVTESCSAAAAAEVDGGLRALERDGRVQRLAPHHRWQLESNAHGSAVDRV